MRRLALAILALIAAVGLAAAPASAAPGTSNLNRLVTGPFEGTTSFVFGGGCSFVFQVFDATFVPTQPPHRPGTLHVEGCVDLPGSQGILNGSFTIATQQGQLQGVASGTIQIIGPADLAFTLQVVSGTGRFARASGVIELTGVWHFEGTPLGGPAPIDGALEGLLAVQRA
jgi:hypothetical protein